MGRGYDTWLCRRPRQSCGWGHLQFLLPQLGLLSFLCGNAGQLKGPWISVDAGCVKLRKIPARPTRPGLRPGRSSPANRQSSPAPQPPRDREHPGYSKTSLITLDREIGNAGACLNTIAVTTTRQCYPEMILLDRAGKNKLGRPQELRTLNSFLIEWEVDWEMWRTPANRRRTRYIGYKRYKEHNCMKAKKRYYLVGWSVGIGRLVGSLVRTNSNLIYWELSWLYWSINQQRDSEE